jgi:hypothetical protein
MTDKKIGNLSIRLDRILLNSYKDHCEKNGYDMSKRLRIFIESEIPKPTHIISVDDIRYEPKSEFEKVDLFGVGFYSIKNSPKVFVLKTEDVILSDVSFFYNGNQYSLNGVHLHKEIDGYKVIECKYFKIEYKG